MYLEGIVRFNSRDQHLCKFIEAKESIYTRKVNSHRTCLKHQHGRRFIAF